MPDFTLEKKHGGVVAGVDEAGRGPWAGPVVAGAVIFKDPNSVPEGVNDSKKLSGAKREKLYEKLMQHAHVGVGIADVNEVDEMNILAATKLAMCRAVEALPVQPVHILVDGNHLPDWAYKAEYVIKGDSKSLSIAAASIIAKVTRDKMMQELAREFPQYGWEKNSGYGTKLHSDALQVHGVTPHHRKSFAPIKKILQGGN